MSNIYEIKQGCNLFMWMLNLEFCFARLYHLKIFWKQLIKMTIAQKNLPPIRVCVRNTKASVGKMYFQPEASMHTYGALLTVVLPRKYSRVYHLKMNRRMLGKSTTGMMLFSLRRGQDSIIQQKW